MHGSVPAEMRAAMAIQERKSGLAARVAEGGLSESPELATCFGKEAKAKVIQHAAYHFAFLGQALELQCPALFADYLQWASCVLQSRGVPEQVRAFHIRQMKLVIVSALEPDEAEVALSYFVHSTGQADADLPHDMTPCAAAYLAALLAFDKEKARVLVRAEVNRGLRLADLYLIVLQPAMREVGRLWQFNRITVAQEHFCASATEQIMAQHYSLFPRQAPRGRTIVCACVAGELHDLGARMLADAFENNGWRAIFFGASMPGKDLLRTVIDCSADVLAVSCTYAPNLHDLLALIEATRSIPECARVTVLVGGYPFNHHADLWKLVGADGSATDAIQAFETATRLLDARGGQRPVSALGDREVAPVG